MELSIVKNFAILQLLSQMLKIWYFLLARNGKLVYIIFRNFIIAKLMAQKRTSETWPINHYRSDSRVNIFSKRMQLYVVILDVISFGAVIVLEIVACFRSLVFNH